MLLGQSAINFIANVFSAAFGLLNVLVFTRWFAPADYGVYVIGVGFATIVSCLQSSWLRLPIIREQARADGTDIRGHIAAGFALSCMVAPIAVGFGCLVGLSLAASIAAALFALSMSYYDVVQELLRARLQALTLMKSTMIRAVLVPCLGYAFARFGHSGLLLLASSAVAYVVAALAFSRSVWPGLRLELDRNQLVGLALGGIPLTVSLTLLALSSVTDRFVVSRLLGPAQAGEYTAGVDLVRQALIIPAVSLAAVFFPLSVKILANRGAAAVRAHLEESLGLLVAVILPAAIGLAVVSPHVANVVLGPGFRSMAAATMPIVSVAVIFQVLTYQYLHISFLLSNRNAFYLINTAVTVSVNIVLAYLLVLRLGAVGAAWARLAAEVLGFIWAIALTRRAFPVPISFPQLSAVLLGTLLMAAAVKGVDLILTGSDWFELSVLIAVGVTVYAGICVGANVAHARERLHGANLILRGMRASPAHGLTRAGSRD
jgi:O-antigen/teichoic acid export membrane protein